MWQVGLSLALLGSFALNRRLAGLKSLRAGAQTQERPRVDDLVPGITILWTGATAAWAVVFIVALDHDWWLGAAALALTCTALIGPVGARNVGKSIGRLYRIARGHAANEVIQRLERVSHDVVARAGDLPPLPGTTYQELLEALAEFKLEAQDRLGPEERRALLDLYHDSVSHEYELYGNPLDFIRLWHNAGIEWLALNATILLRAGLVAGAWALPAGLTAGVVPEGATAWPWALLVAWSAAMALGAPVVASTAMDRPERLLGGVLVVELVLLAAVLATTPSWAVLASMAVVWNCANRLDEGFEWLTSWLIALVAAAASTGALVAHGAGAWSVLEAVLGLIVAALISASFTVFSPGSVFVATVIPARAWFARRAVRRELGPFREQAQTRAAAYLDAADACADAHPRAARVAIATALPIQRMLDETGLRMSPGVVDTLDRLVKRQLAGSGLRFGGVQADSEALSARWRADHPGTGLLVEAIEILTNEAAVHGRGDFTLALSAEGPELVVLAGNGLRRAVNAPRRGTTHLDAIVEALGARRGPERSSDGTHWTVTFAVPVSIVELTKPSA